MVIIVLCKNDIYPLLSLTRTLLILDIAWKSKIGFIFTLWRPIYEAKCKWNHFNQPDGYPINKNAWSGQL